MEGSMSRKRMIIIISIVGAAILCLCTAGAAYMIINVPLGEPLFLSTSEAFPVQETALELNQTYVSEDIPIVNPTITEEHTNSQTRATNCGQTGSMNILVMGVDSPGSNGPNGPLDVRLVKVDFSQKTAVVFSFPRDLWIPVTGLETLGFAQARLGEAYLIARSNGGMSVAEATNILAQNLYNNFGAVSHHYITAKMSTLAIIIDTVGGITVTVPYDYDGSPYGFHYFPAGTNSMNGELALEYAIAPSSLSQWEALARKTLVLSALFNKLFTPGVIPQLPELVPQFLQVATTDLTLQQFMDLICISQQIPWEQVTFVGAGPEDVTAGPSGVLYPNTPAIRSKVEQYLS
jgi:LCP family protein required for cell wall assembly